MPAPTTQKRLPAWVVPTAAIVLVVAGALVLILLNAGGDETAAPSEPPSTGTVPAASEAIETITSIPAAAYDRAGVSAVDPRAFVPLPEGEPPLERDGKPEVLYIGAEYCPFCAGQRWVVVAALSRFGEFSGLEESYSALDDVYPGTKTVTFRGSDFTSDHVAFTGVETQDSEYQPLDTLTPDQEAVIGKYDAPPYVDAQSAGAIPFLDLGNDFVVVGATVPVDQMEGMTAAQIADATADPSTPIGATVLGSANLMSAIICDQNGGQPADVCGSAGVRAGAEALGL